MTRAITTSHRRTLTLSILASLAALALLAGPALGQVQPAVALSELAEVDQQAVAANDRLLAALRQFDSASLAMRDTRLTQVVELAAQRKQRLLKLLDRDAVQAGLRMLPEALRTGMPTAAQGHLEQAADISGQVFALIAEDFTRGLSTQRFFLHGTRGQPDLELHLADPTASERDLLGWTGKRASIKAMRLDGHLIVIDKKQVILLAADGSGTTGTTSSSATAMVQGNQNTLVILTNFSDKALSCTATDVSNRLFGTTGATTNNDYMETSRNQVSFSGQVIGPFTIPYTSTGACDTTGWAAAAEAAAKAAGVDPAQFAHVNYTTPSNGTCGWAGLAATPGRQSWVQSCGSTGVYTHELGHNLSFHHASTPSAEYGDNSDPMGGNRMVRLGAANQSMAGWLPQGTVQDVTTGGSYALAALELSTATSPQVLRLFKPDTKEYYYISLRQAIGLDSTLASGYLNVLSVHRAWGTLPTKTFLLQNLAAGQIFTDATNGITVTNQGLSGNLSTVSVSFGGASCTRTAPMVSLAPASKSAPAGSSLAYTVSVNNLNSSACGTSSFNLAQSLPAGFSGSLAAASLSIAAGGSASTTTQLTSAAATPDGTYGFKISAADSSNATGPSAAAGSYVVFNDLVPPTVAITSPANGAVISGQSVSFAASATDVSGIQAVEFYVGSSLLGRDTSAPYSVNWNTRKLVAGPQTLRVRAIDAAGNAAEQSISVILK